MGKKIYFTQLKTTYFPFLTYLLLLCFSILLGAFIKWSINVMVNLSTLYGYFISGTYYVVYIFLCDSVQLSS